MTHRGGAGKSRKEGSARAVPEKGPKRSSGGRELLKKVRKLRKVKKGRKG